MTIGRAASREPSTLGLSSFRSVSGRRSVSERRRKHEFGVKEEGMRCGSMCHDKFSLVSVRTKENNSVFACGIPLLTPSNCQTFPTDSLHAVPGNDLRETRRIKRRTNKVQSHLLAIKSLHRLSMHFEKELHLPERSWRVCVRIIVLCVCVCLSVKEFRPV